MENLKLNKQEKMELEKRGFISKDIIGFEDFIKNTMYGFVFLGILLFIPLLYSVKDISGIYLKINLGFIGIWLISNFYCLYYYVISSRIFITKQGIIAFGKMGLKLQRTILKVNRIVLFLKFYEKLSKLPKIGRGGNIDILGGLSIIGPLITLAGWSLLINQYFPITNELDIAKNIIFILIPISIFLIMGYMLNYIVNITIPLYAFGNLGEKIQKLTPKIEEQSQKIQSEIQSDMNYFVLSSGFDSLSSTFSNIVTLVIKLEKAEKRANKGNLFDSEKYINSLRLDIVSPLISLKIFLEEKKIELTHSQQELTRVRIGGNKETGNIELQSTRGELLIKELTEKIEKLDTMIEKIRHK
ncbi:hypothetical protein K2X92_00185 [Candidatus Gracilibacteria bacterium]|nr:hypothetical protein [Candidatus Gracilibacteria bacterium]